MVFLDKYGYPVVTIKGRPIINFIRKLIHTRMIRRGFWNGTRVVRLVKMSHSCIDWRKIRRVQIEIIPALDIHNLGGHDQKAYETISVIIRALSADGLYEHSNSYTLAKEKSYQLNVVIANLLHSIEIVANRGSSATQDGQAQTIREDM